MRSKGSRVGYSESTCHGFCYAITTRSREAVVNISPNTARIDKPDTPERHELFRQLKKELEVHAAVEDLQVYRVFQQSDATHDDAHEALEAHATIKTLLDQLETAPAYDRKWVPKFQELKKLVEAHVDAEVNEMFRKTKAIMTPQEAEELGVAVANAKQGSAVMHP
jgi:hypothetical protein